MILPFKQFFDKEKQKPTFFAEKIWIAGRKELLYDVEFKTYSGAFNFSPTANFKLSVNQINIISQEKLNPKIHTIRQDLKNRWKADNKIHPVYNNRTKNQFQFAPTFQCKGIQTIEIKHHGTSKEISRIIVDGRDLLLTEIYTLALNDGFDNVMDFFKWFDTDFKGKIIHFTDFNY